MHTMNDKDKKQISNLQVSVYNDDLWFGFNVKNNFGEKEKLKSDDEKLKEQDKPALEQALVGTYYKVDKDNKVFARGDLVNHFLSAGLTHKNSFMTMSTEGFYGLSGTCKDTGAEVEHKGLFGKPLWMRMGVEMPLSADTQVNWEGKFANDITSTLTFAQKLNKNMTLQFENKYSSSNSTPVDVGMYFTYKL